MEEYQKILRDRYGCFELDKLDKMLLDGMCEIPSEHGFEDEVLAWLKKHPDADLQEVAIYVSSFLEPLEIVDDDELDEDCED